MQAWLFLILAGFLEIGFTTSMKLSQGFSNWFFSALFLICAICSFVSLSLAIKTISLGTAYAVWTGIGAAGTAIIGMTFFNDPMTFSRLFFLSLIIFGVIGMKFMG